MCGITGAWLRHESGDISPAVIETMTKTLSHRGPDDFGIYRQGAVALGHTRLAVIDVSRAGHQPMTSPDGRYVLVFNGEIYNFAELKDRHCRHLRFTSSTDTEVLLHLLIQKGVAALPLLRGMFALALWDSQKKELLLARDAFGKKPLYYCTQGDLFLFGSEPKAILAHPSIATAIDRSAITKYFLYEYVPGRATGYAGIWQLGMGQSVRVTANQATVDTWWQPTFVPKNKLRSLPEAAAKLDQVLAQAVERRLVADVPVGVFLSGGLDSTSITWYMRQQAPNDLHSFSVSFDEPSFDESRYSRMAAQSLGTTHHDLKFNVSEFSNVMKDIGETMDVPLGDASLAPTYAISQLARTYITVVLDGDGSDELLGGYGTFAAARLAERIPRLPPALGRLVHRLSLALPTSYKNFSFDFKVKSFLEGLDYSLPYRNQVWLGSFSDKTLRRLLMPSWHQYIGTVFEDINEIEEQIIGLDTFDAVSLLKIYHYLSGDLLVKLDRSTMLVALEARTPFLDVDVANLLMHMPVRFKQQKAVLKHLMRGRIPQEIIDRPKRGFGVPLGFWLRGPLHQWARNILNDAKMKADAILQPDFVHMMFAQHRRGQADWRKQLWTLIMWQLWFDRWIARRSG